SSQAASWWAACSGPRPAPPRTPRSGSTSTCPTWRPRSLRRRRPEGRYGSGGPRSAGTWGGGPRSATRTGGGSVCARTVPLSRDAPQGSRSVVAEQPVPLDGLVAARADTDRRHAGADELLEPEHVGLRVGRQLLEGAAAA